MLRGKVKSLPANTPENGFERARVLWVIVCECMRVKSPLNGCMRSGNGRIPSVLYALHTKPIQIQL